MMLFREISIRNPIHCYTELDWVGLTFGSFETLGVLKEAMVDMLALRGIVAGHLVEALCRQRWKLGRLLVAIVEGAGYL
jgi:hypothetical protein